MAALLPAGVSREDWALAMEEFGPWWDKYAAAYRVRQGIAHDGDEDTFPLDFEIPIPRALEITGRIGLPVSESHSRPTL